MSLTNLDRKIPWRFPKNQVEREDSEPCMSLNQGRSLPVHTIQGSVSSADLNAISFLWQCTNLHWSSSWINQEETITAISPHYYTLHKHKYVYIIKFRTNHRSVQKARTKTFCKPIQDSTDFYLLPPYPMWSRQGLITQRFCSRSSFAPSAVRMKSNEAPLPQEFPSGNAFMSATSLFHHWCLPPGRNTSKLQHQQAQ